MLPALEARTRFENRTDSMGTGRKRVPEHKQLSIYSARFRQSPKGVVFQEPWKPGMAS
jgi:hypothetical protein